MSAQIRSVKIDFSAKIADMELAEYVKLGDVPGWYWGAQAATAGERVRGAVRRAAENSIMKELRERETDLTLDLHERNFTTKVLHERQNWYSIEDNTLQVKGTLLIKFNDSEDE